MSKLSSWLVCMFILNWITYSLQVQFCQKDFKTLGHNLWRCKVKLQQETISEQHVSGVTIETESNSIVNLNNNININDIKQSMIDYLVRIITHRVLFVTVENHAMVSEE